MMCPQWSVGLGCGLLLYCSAQGLAWADAVHLSNGRTLQGIVIQETEIRVEVQVAWEGYVFLDRDSIVGIEYSSKEERQQVLAQWHKELLAVQEHERQRLAFERAQRAQGLVQYRGRWVTTQELAAIKQELAQAQRRREEEEARRQREKEEEAQQEEQTRLLAQQLQALQEEHVQLQEELAHQRWLARTRVVVQQCDPALVTDEQGNLIRVHQQAGHQFFVAPDGQQTNLQEHADHLAFTDERGIHHDLR